MQIPPMAPSTTSFDAAYRLEAGVTIDICTEEHLNGGVVTSSNSKIQLNAYQKYVVQPRVADLASLIDGSEDTRPSNHDTRCTSSSEIAVDTEVPEEMARREESERSLSRSIPARTESLSTQTTSQRISKLVSGLSRERRQFTLAMFLDEIALRREKVARRPAWRKPRDPSFIGYVSVLITHVRLVELYQARRMFRGRCRDCKTEVFANTPLVGEHQSCPAPRPTDHEAGSRCRREDQRRERDRPTAVDLDFNPHILAGISDETGGFRLRRATDTHGLSTTDQAVYGMTGLGKRDFFLHGTRPVAPRILERLHRIESQVRWARVTLVLAWVAPGGADVDTAPSGHDLVEGTSDGTAIVLDVFG